MIMLVVLSVETEHTLLAATAGMTSGAVSSKTRLPVIHWLLSSLVDSQVEPTPDCSFNT